MRSPPSDSRRRAWKEHAMDIKASSRATYLSLAMAILTTIMVGPELSAQSLPPRLKEAFTTHLKFQPAEINSLEAGRAAAPMESGREMTENAPAWSCLTILRSRWCGSAAASTSSSVIPA